MNYEKNARDFDLWGKNIDPSGTISEKEFNEMSIEEKIKMQEDNFGTYQDVFKQEGLAEEEANCLAEYCKRTGYDTDRALLFEEEILREAGLL